MSICLIQRDSGDEELYSVYVPTNHLYIGDIYLLNSQEIIRPNLSVREGIGMLLASLLWWFSQINPFVMVKVIYLLSSHFSLYFRDHCFSGNVNASGDFFHRKYPSSEWQDTNKPNGIDWVIVLNACTTCGFTLSCQIENIIAFVILSSHLSLISRVIRDTGGIHFIPASHSLAIS